MSTINAAPQPGATFDYNHVIQDVQAEIEKPEATTEGQPEEEPVAVEATEEAETEETKEAGEQEGEEEGETSDEEAVPFITIDRHGIPHEFDEVEAKELISKGYDYTAKTMELSEQRKAFEAESKATREAVAAEKARVSEELKFNHIMTTWAQHLQETNPDLFAELDETFRNFEAPPMPEPAKEDPEKVELRNQLEQKELDAIRATFNSEMNQVKAEYGKEFEAAGIKPDWEKIEGEMKELYAQGAENVDMAFNARYGRVLRRGQVAKKKATEGLKKAAASAKTQSNSDNSGVTKESKLNPLGDSGYQSIIRDYL